MHWREQVNFWRERFALRPPTLQLPNDRPRPPVPDWHCGAEVLSLESSLWNRVVELAMRLAGPTTSNPIIADPALAGSIAILAATWIILGRWAGEEDVAVACFGTRALPHNTIGPLARPLPLRCHVHAKLSFPSLFSNLLEMLAQCMRHQQVAAETFAAEAGEDVSPIGIFLPGALPAKDSELEMVFPLMSPYDLSFRLHTSQNGQGTTIPALM